MPGREKDSPASGELIAVFVPSTPTPITGFVVFVPAEEVYELDISNEDAIKMLVSGGIATPPVMHRVPRANLAEPPQAAG
jgi:uncharacterized membrane protein